jgi:LuxR family transcriptional regulator, maltose regulon positive regulatory protein
MRPAGELAWLTLDEHDDDPVRFWHLVSAALRATSPDRSVPDDDFDLYDLRGLDRIDLVIGQLKRRQSCSLVIDNFHLITEVAIIDSVARFVEQLPAGSHVILAGQHISSKAITRFLHKDAATAIGPSDLAFTVEDCGGLMALSAGKMLSIDELTALTERSEGWAAGLYLAANAIRESEDSEGFVRQYSGAYGPVAAYLEHELLQRQPPDVIRFLLQTSVLDRLRPELCCAVTDCPDAGQVLAAMADRNMFVIRQDDPKEPYRYHRLLRDLLRSRLHLEDSDGVAASHRRAAEWYRQTGFPDEAAFHFAEAGRARRGFRAALR